MLGGFSVYILYGRTMDRPELTLVTHFSSIPDYRENHNKRHILVEIIVMAVCCTICGANAFTEIAVIAQAKKEWFHTFLRLPAGIPSHDTFNRVLARIDPKAIQRCFISWVHATFPPLDPQQIALDGKELHHSSDPVNDFANLRMISAWAVDNGLVLGQVAVDDASNEITELPTVLELVDVHDCDITADALHCQIETRRYGITDTLSYLSSRDAWNGLQSIGMVETERQIGARIERKARYFISSRPADVQRFAQRVRSHWHIENKLHWRLDVIMGEDDAHIRVDHGPENMAVLRHIALNLLKHEPSKLSIQSKRLQAACDNKYLEKVIKMQTPY